MYFETLPAELRHQLFALFDLNSLRAVVLASPVYHNHYNADRKRILRDTLHRTLGPVLIDAVYVQGTNHPCFQLIRALDGKITRQFVTNYLKDLKDPYNTIDCWFSQALTDFQNYISMAAFYYSTVSPLANLYLRWTLTNLDQLCGRTPVNTLLSRTEQIRILRALYRYHLYGNMFAVKPHSEWNPNNTEEGQNPTLLAFNSPFESLTDEIEPWEKEEIFSVHFFAITVLQNSFEEINWDVYTTKLGYHDHRAALTEEQQRQQLLVEAYPYVPGPNSVRKRASSLYFMPGELAGEFYL
jgi:hypothetical protein